jgi:hypothetical protein
MFIFVSLVLSYHIHRERKHCDLNHKENHKDFQIDNDSFDHGNNITKTFDHLQIKHWFPKTHQQQYYVNYFGKDGLCIVIVLYKDVEVADKNVKEVDVILRVWKVFRRSIF